VSVAFFLFALLLSVAPALAMVGQPVFDGLFLGAIASAIAIAAAHLSQDDLHRLTKLLRPIAPLLLVPGIWMLLQISPLPRHWLANSIWTSAAAALGKPAGGLISIDVGATVLAFARYSQMVAIMLLSAALALDRRRAEGILILLTAAAALIAAEVVLFDLGYFQTLDFGRTDTRAEALSVAVLGLILSGATAIQAFKSYETKAFPSSASTALPSAMSVIAFGICLSAVVSESAPIVIFAAACGLGVLLALIAIRRLRIGRWGQAGLAASALVFAVGFFASSSASRQMDATLILASPSQGAIAVAERMLSEAPWVGNGAGTFDALVPIYRDAGAGAFNVSGAPTAAASIAIELGLPFLWIVTIAALSAALLLFRGALRRGRDYAYAGAGTACILTTVILSFSGAGIFGRAAAVLAAATCGVALAQSRGRGETTESQSATASTSFFGVKNWCRVTLLAVSAVCAVQAIWIVVPELLHLRTIRIPFNVQPATPLDQDRANRAAAFAMVRGDLWAEAGFADASRLGTDAAGGPEKELEVVNARTALERALRYSPHRGDVWLMLSMLAERYKVPGLGPNPLLKMSFYTAPNELALIPQRLLLSSRIRGIEDPEMQDMIKRDIRLLLTRGSNPKSALVAAYKNASAENRPFIERFVSEIDPTSAASMRAE
jgi:hypothetical protein